MPADRVERIRYAVQHGLYLQPGRLVGNGKAQEHRAVVGVQLNAESDLAYLLDEIYRLREKLSATR